MSWGYSFIELWGGQRGGEILILVRGGSLFEVRITSSERARRRRSRGFSS